MVVGHLGRDGVAARIAEKVGVAPPDAMVDVVHEQSGGLPTLVDIVTLALRRPAGSTPATPTPSAGPT